MKNAIILHGISSGPNDFWFPYIKKELETKRYHVWVPQLPGADKADLKEQLPWIMKKAKITKDTVLIGHSSGACLILAILDEIKVKIKKAILVSGFLTKEKPRPFCAVKDEKDYNWKKMKENAESIIFINSTNDPWGCNDKQGRLMFDRLGGLLIVNNDGHMGSEYFKQPYKKFPLLQKLIEI